VIESVVEERSSDVPYDGRTRQKIQSWYRRVKSHLRNLAAASKIRFGLP